jgi:NAD+ kinase
VKFGIAGNLDKAELPRVVESLLRRFQNEKIAYSVHNELAKFVKAILRTVKIPKETLVKERDLGTSCDMVIALGGDGTILRMARLLAPSKTPVLGINLGKLGFLAEVSIDELDECLTQILLHHYKIEPRTMLEASGDSMKTKFAALNDIVVGKYNFSRVMDIETYVNGEFLATFTGDGIVISTPTGSTAYALSNGGPIVTPQNKTFTISPICPHTLTARPVIVPDDSVITLKILSSFSHIQLTADGQMEKLLKSPVSITIKKAPFEARLVKREGTNYYDLLRRKLHWAKDVRKQEN